jgi:hypothetical protein
MNNLVPLLRSNNNNKVSYKLFSQLTEKEQLGYDFEVREQSFLHKLKVNFSSNPLNKFFWKRLKGKGTDIQTDTLDIECKFVRRKVYPAHLKRNVYPRFKNNNKKKIVLTNDKSLWTSKAIDRLNESKIFLWNEHDVKEYYSKPSFTSIYNSIRTIIECISNLYKFTVDRVSSIFNRTETNKTQTLNQYLIDKSISETDKKEVLSVPKLNCYNCSKSIDDINKIKDKYGLRYVYNMFTGHMSYPLIYDLEPNAEPKHSQNSKTQSLNQYLTDKTDSKISNNQILSGRDLNCYNCLKRDKCPILQKLNELEVKRPAIRLVQSNITDNLKNIPKIDREDFKKRNREWLIRYNKVWIEQLKCLNKRTYLQLKMNYKLFNIEPSSSNHKV